MMNKSPFIQVNTKKAHVAVRRWLLFTLVTAIVAFVLMLFMYAHLYYKQHIMQQELDKLEPTSAQMHACLADKRRLKEQVTMLKAQQAKATRIMHRPKNPHGLLVAVSNSLPAQASMATMRLQRKKLEVQLLAPSTESVMQIVQTLQAEQSINKLTIESIEPDKSGIKSHLVATIV